MLLKRVSYPCRYSDMIPRFGRPVSVLSLITNHTLDYIYENHGHLITQWNRNILNPRAHRAMLIPSQEKELRSTIVSDSSTEPSGRSPDQDMLRELFTMDIKGFIPLNFNRWRCLMD